VRVGGMLSDHALVHFTVSVKTLRVDEQWLTCRKWRLLLREAFASDLAATKLCADMDVLRDQSVDDLIQLYRDVLTRLLDRSSRSAADARRPHRGLMLTAVVLDDAQELLKDVFDVDDVVRTDVNGH